MSMTIVYSTCTETVNHLSRKEKQTKKKMIVGEGRKEVILERYLCIVFVLLI